MEHTEFTRHQPGYPTYDERYWFRDGLLAVMGIAEDDENYCGQVGYDANTALREFHRVRDLLESGSFEAIATEFARCWAQDPKTAANCIREGKAMAEAGPLLPDGEFALQQPGSPTEHEIRWWRDGVLHMVDDEAEERRYCDENYGLAKNICDRYRSVCDAIRDASTEVIAAEFERCWQERPSDVADLIRLGKERQRLASEAYKVSKKRLIDASSALGPRECVAGTDCADGGAM